MCWWRFSFFKYRCCILKVLLWRAVTKRQRMSNQLHLPTSGCGHVRRWKSRSWKLHAAHVVSILQRLPRLVVPQLAKSNKKDK
uniref:Secreted protein n=1 Tax=Rhipicephalus appendiculatus TaxID=34631 RepID=A0A131YGT5_RHIAP